MIRIQSAVLALGAILSVAPAASTVAAVPTVSAFDADGTLHIPPVTMPLSGLTSDAFRANYAEKLKAGPRLPASPPQDASKAEWDKFDALADEKLFGPNVKWLTEHYAVDMNDTKMGGVSVSVITPKAGVSAANKARVLISLHGGGFELGRGLLAPKNEGIPVAALGRIKVVAVDYRMAPYYHFPAATEDVEAVYRELLKTYKPEHIGIYGCSAGGMLTAQSVAWFQTKKLPRPGAVGVFCATVFDFAAGGDSTAMGWTPGGLVMSADPTGKPNTRIGYMTPAKADDPHAYPGVSPAVLAKFPPTLLVTGTRSFDLSGSAASNAALLKAGVDSSLYVQEGGVHAYFASAAIKTPEARDTWTYIARWFNAHLAP